MDEKWTLEVRREKECTQPVVILRQGKHLIAGWRMMMRRLPY